ncbi:MAG: hypothetical protein EOO05_11360 [Chitinophagaceae bacterium]|nr:MAG: hypothetical protein EOO05_11360 [Chitinophagaceae bacterium]
MQSKPLQLLLSVCILACSQACNKAKDYVEENPDRVVDGCQVQKITTTKDWLIADYKYNRNGDPVSVTYDFTSTETPNFLFKYDKKHRLVQCIEYFNQGNVFLWSKYFYDENDMIVSDSTFATGLLVNGQVEADPDADGYYETRVYTYDSKKRISTITTHYPYEPPGGDYNTQEFIYDANGNRQDDSGTPIVYDSKINIHRTHRVFMFIDRQYSVNNPVTVASYNSSHLPVAFGLSEQNRLLKANLQNAVVTYKG